MGPKIIFTVYISTAPISFTIRYNIISPPCTSLPNGLFHLTIPIEDLCALPVPFVRHTYASLSFPIQLITFIPRVEEIPP